MPPSPARRLASRARSLLAHGLKRELFLAAAMIVLAVPALAAVAAGPAEAAAAHARDRPWRETTGYVVLAAIAAQMALAAGGRLLRRRVVLLTRWRLLHRLAGVPLLGALLVHTRGRAGTGLDRCLLVALVGMLLVAQLGHVVKAFARASLYAYAHPERRERARRLDGLVNGEEGWVHRSGYQLHIVLATVVTVLSAVHVALVFLF